MSDFESTPKANPQAIPLPTQIPEPPDLSKIPPRILHSATVETLIGHADDLSSRLKVHIRRNGQLEGYIVELENNIQNAEIQRQTIIAQLEILREKDRAVAEKQTAIESKHARANEELELSQLQVQELEKRNRELQLSNGRAWAFQRRIRRWVRPGFAERERTTKALRGHILSLEAEILRLNSALSQVKEELTYQRSDADHKLTAAERDRTRLVDHYEKLITGTTDERNQLKGELQRASEKLEALDRATNDSARANNEKVFFERRAEEFEGRLKSETERLKGALDDLSAECAALRAGAESAREFREQADKQRNEADSSRERAEKQLMSLREIWQEQSVRLQALEAKNEGLERLNAELSRKLSQNRDQERVRLHDQALDRVGFIEGGEAREAKLKKLDTLLTDLEMRAFGIQPTEEKSPSA